MLSISKIKFSRLLKKLTEWQCPKDWGLSSDECGCAKETERCRACWLSALDMDDFEAVNEEGRCPKCGSVMVERSGPFGSFMGCIRYLKCKGVVKK